jgi:hypothetical protein
VARKKPGPSRLAVAYQACNELVPEDHSLPSLRERPPRVQGHAFRFFLVLPLYCAEGKPVFTAEHFSHLFPLFNARFGGVFGGLRALRGPFLRRIPA